jgi:hypothetical protein
VGCRSTSYLVYASLSTVVWALLLLSSVLSHYPSGVDLSKEGNRPLSASIAANLSVVLRRLGKIIATINAAGIITANIFQFSGFFDRCYCNSSVIGLGTLKAYKVIILQEHDILLLRNGWIGGTVLALGSAAIFVGVLNLLINPSFLDV